MPPGIEPLFEGKSSLGISGCRILHSGAPLRCFESRCYYLNDVQNAPSHADVTSISLLTHLKKLCRTTNKFRANAAVSLDASSSSFITIQSFPVSGCCRTEENSVVFQCSCCAVWGVFQLHVVKVLDGVLRCATDRRRS